MEEINILPSVPILGLDIDQWRVWMGKWRYDSRKAMINVIAIRKTSRVGDRAKIAAFSK